VSSTATTASGARSLTGGPTLSSGLVGESGRTTETSGVKCVVREDRGWVGGVSVMNGSAGVAARVVGQTVRNA